MCAFGSAPWSSSSCVNGAARQPLWFIQKFGCETTVREARVWPPKPSASMVALASASIQQRPELNQGTRT